MDTTVPLQEIARVQEAKARAYLQTRRQTRLWHASCPMPGSYADSMSALHALGFDNAPFGAVDFGNGIFFYEQVMGCRLKVLDGREGSFFHTWCEPIISSPEQIDRLEVDLRANPVWEAYGAAVRRYVASTPPAAALPLTPWACCPLDLACSLCGAERLYTFMYDAPGEVETLFARITDTYLETRRQMEATGVRWITGLGFPGVYISDLHLPGLQPAFVERFVLPSYERLVRECGGGIVAVHSADTGVLTRILAWDDVVGCFFDKRLPFPAIRDRLGNKLFMIANYAYDDAVDRPTLKGGMYWNPIVHSYSRELDAVYGEFARDFSMLVMIERPTLDEVCRVRDGLRGLLARR